LARSSLEAARRLLDRVVLSLFRLDPQAYPICNKIAALFGAAHFPHTQSFIIYFSRYSSFPTNYFGSRQRTGRAINPSYKVIAALASYFNVSPGYFFGEIDKGTFRLVGT